MPVIRLRRPRYADVAATLALLFAMSGTAYAVTALPANSVGTTQLKTGAVTSPKLAGNAVGTGKIQGGSVTTGKLADGSVTTGKLASGSVTTGQLGDGSVTTGQLGDGAVTGAKLANGSVGAATISDHTIPLSKLVGTDVSGAISLSASAGQCAALTMGIPGAQVGQAALLTFTTTPPAGVTFSPLYIPSANHVTVDICNEGGSAVNVSNLGVRVKTFS
jgi:hypothetical protein